MRSQRTILMLASAVATLAVFALVQPSPAAPEDAPMVPDDGPAETAQADPPGTVKMTVADARKRLFEEGRTAAFKRTTLIERVAMEALMPLMIDRARRGNARTADLRPMARAARLSIETWRVHDGLFIALLEPQGEARGTGAYIVRVSAPGAVATAPTVILQAPHAYFDLHTGRIAAGMFFGKREGRRARALFVNTLQRYQRGEPDRRSPADVCHRPDHLFSAATDRAVASLGATLVVQLHGFDEEGVPDGVDMILSAGRDMPPSPGLRWTAEQLRGVFGDGVRLFPADVRALGGTKNVQGRLLHAHRDASFLHIEMAKALRLKLRSTPALRHDLARAVYGGAQEGGR